MITLDITQIITIIGGIFDKKFQYFTNESQYNSETFTKTISTLGEIAKKVLEEGWTSKTIAEYRELVKNSEELSDEDKFIEYQRINNLEKEAKKDAFKRAIAVVAVGSLAVPVCIWAIKSGRGIAAVPGVFLNRAGRVLKMAFV